jgi:hypothetical protein
LLLFVEKGCYREEEAGSNAVSLAMLLTSTTAVALTQTEPGVSRMNSVACSPRDAPLMATVCQT